MTRKRRSLIRPRPAPRSGSEDAPPEPAEAPAAEEPIDEIEPDDLDDAQPLPPLALDPAPHGGDDPMDAPAPPARSPSSSAFPSMPPAPLTPPAAPFPTAPEASPLGPDEAEEVMVDVANIVVSGGPSPVSDAPTVPKSRPMNWVAPDLLPVVDGADEEEETVLHEPEPTGEEDAPMTAERAGLSPSFGTGYTVPEVPETLRRFDAVATSDSFAGTVESMARTPDTSSTESETPEPSVPDVRFEPAPRPPPPAPSRGVPWIAIGLAGMLGAVTAIALAVLLLPRTRAPEPERALEPAPARVLPAEPPPSLPPPVPRRASSEASRSARGESSAASGESSDIAPATPAALPGTLQVRSNKKALVYLDAKPVGLTPVSLELPMGAHRVSVMLPGQPDTRQTKTAQLAEGDQQTLDFAF